MSVDDRDRPLQFQLWNRGQNSVEELEHFSVRVRAAAEEDDARSMSPLERQQPRIVEIGRHDHAVLRPSGIEDLAIGRGSESDGGGVDSFMPGTPEVPYRIGCHRHVHEESHPPNSLTSSSSRLAA